MVLQYTRASESPRRYYYWSTLVAIAAVVRDKVYLDKFQYKLYPNIYVLLVGKSGLRKGPPIALARKLVTEVNSTRIFAGRVSIQGVISELSKARTKAGGGPPQTDGAGALFASEFASFIIADPSALTILTDLYDGHYNPDWSYQLRNSPVEKITAPCITLFGATNEIHMRDIIPNNAIGGGFIARTFIIYADTKSGVNALVRRPAGIVDYSALPTRLRQISTLSGQFDWSERGRDLYELWYGEYQAKEQLDEDTTGTMERLHDHVLKTAMLLSLARDNFMRLEYEDIEEAIRVCKEFIPGAKRVSLGQIGQSVSANGTSVLLRELITTPEHKISRSAALKRHWQHFDSFELDRITESLFAQKAIFILIGPDEEGKNDQIYTLNPKVLERYQARVEKGR